MSEQQTELNNVQSSQDIVMESFSKVNLNSQPSEMNIDSNLNDNTPPPSGTTTTSSTADEQEPQAKPLRRRSTLILQDEPDFEKAKSSHNEHETEHEAHEAHNNEHPEAHPMTVPIEIQWFQGGENVFITGSFTGWRKMIKLVKENDTAFSIKLRLPIGTHRFRFIVDNELRFSDYLPTATDQMGNFLNYIEVQNPESEQLQDYPLEHPQYDLEHNKEDLKPGKDAQQKAGDDVQKIDSNLGLTNDDDDMGNGYSRFHEEQISKPRPDYVTAIPPIFTDPSVMEQYYVTLDNQQNNNSQSWLTPPQLPPHLENVILNNFSASDKTNSSGALPIPNHVVLNHLATTSIKHNTLAVASVVRYKRKYATQVLYAPLQ